MATNIRPAMGLQQQVNNAANKVFIGSGAPADDDRLTTGKHEFPQNCTYIDGDTGDTYFRTGVAGTAADFKKNAAGGGGGVTSITYADLVTAIGAGTLTPGGQYLITDYATKHYIVDANGNQYLDTIITGEAEPLLVTAIAADKISHEAKSALHPEDIIHYDWNPDNWLQDISFSDVSTPATPVIIAGFKGVVYFRHDTLLDNYMPGDWRNSKSRRWNDGTGYYAIKPNGAGVTDTEDYQDLKAFVETGAADGTYEFCVRGNHFEPFKDSNDLNYWAATILPNHVIYLEAGWYCFFCNQIGPNAYHNTFKGYAEGNTCGVEFIGNTCGANFIGNTCGANFSSNTCGANFIGNTCGANFSGNTCGANFSGNTCGAYFRGNTCGADFSHNTCGAYFIGNTCGANFRFNKVHDGLNNGHPAINFTAATHVYANYNCELYVRPDGTQKLRYYDNTDTLVIVNANA